MTAYTVTAKRWEHGLELHIDGIGVTQSRTLDDAEAMVRDYIESLTGRGTDGDEIVIRRDGTVTADGKGSPLADGDHVEAWHEGERYTATVKAVRPQHPGCGGHRHIVLIRDGDRAEVESFSDAVAVIP